VSKIRVHKVDDTTYEVAVEAATPTTHTVTVDPSYYEKLTGGGATPEQLITRSFEFLLERESNTSILSEFDLPVIGRYFPEYEDAIKGMLK